ncbi:MAG: hypothetical protein QOH66_2292, partial [Actinomycetota bacterium]|nr:hypothetical protein [Actinomycetota bacterium]MEA2589365.1 hypothetical protein [Actinomycetota bacterium]
MDPTLLHSGARVRLGQQLGRGG